MERLNNKPQPVVKKFQILLFPEQDAKLFYKIVFGRWFLFLVLMLLIINLYKFSVHWSVLTASFFSLFATLNVLTSGMPPFRGQGHAVLQLNKKNKKEAYLEKIKQSQRGDSRDTYRKPLQSEINKQSQDDLDRKKQKRQPLIL
jgi:hypothetical protein